MNNYKIRVVFFMVVPLFFNTTIEAQILSSTFFKDIPEGKTFLALFADGNIKGITADDKNATGTGSLGINIQKGHLSWNAVISVASSIDTLKEGVGAIILTPGTGIALTSGFLDVRIRDICKIEEYSLGLHFYIGTSRSIWNSANSSSSAITSGFGALIYSEIINTEINNNEISFGIELGPSYRWIAGDIKTYTNRFISFL